MNIISAYYIKFIILFLVINADEVDFNESIINPIINNKIIKKMAKCYKDKFSIQLIEVESKW